MPKRTPLPSWMDQDVYLIGGGPSLCKFDWAQLKSLNTIGCNQAFKLGSSICKICTFGDYNFWQKYGTELDFFDGWVATNYLVGGAPDWLHFFKRQNEGLSTTELAWNGNTGCSAINLALMLGASRVLLLGFDNGGMEPVNSSAELASRSHWHNDRIEVPTPAHYERFATGFFAVAEALPVVFPGKRVVNVSNGSSKLKCFAIQSFEDVGLIL